MLKIIKGRTNCVDQTKYIQEAFKLEINSVKFKRKKHQMRRELQSFGL